ncbi:MAG: enoyl-CoA hydratase/isomerase family protein, partial [Chloroflexi bacterium]
MLVLTQQKDQVYEITLNRPDKRNAMNHALMQALEAAIDEAEKCQGVRAVVIRGAGASFSAGIDLLGFSDMIEVFGENWQ